MQKVFIDNDNMFKLDGLVDVQDDSYQNAATVTIRLLTLAYVEVLAAQTLNYISASNGKYQASVDKTSFAPLAVGARYLVEFSAVEGGLDYLRYIKVVAARRFDT